MRVLAILFALVPVSFALIRALRTGSDLRAVWMAGAAFSIAAFVTARLRGREATPAFGLTLFVLCTLGAAAVAMLLGAKAAFGVWAVAIAFGFCVAAAVVLYSRTGS